MVGRITEKVNHKGRPMVMIKHSSEQATLLDRMKENVFTFMKWKKKMGEIMNS